MVIGLSVVRTAKKLPVACNVGRARRCECFHPNDELETLVDVVVATLLWLYATPSMETMKTPAPGWIAFLFLRNAGIDTNAYDHYLHHKFSECNIPMARSRSTSGSAPFTTARKRPRTA